MFIRIGNLTLNTNSIISVDAAPKYKGVFLTDHQMQELADVPCVRVVTTEYCTADNLGDNLNYYFYGQTATDLVEYFGSNALCVSNEQVRPECLDNPYPKKRASINSK